jgi:spermidine dehydrogenase
MRKTEGRSSRDFARPEILRRDFLNGCLIASGGLAVECSLPLRALAGESEGVCADVDGDNQHFLRSGNLPSTFNVAHWMRDGRLDFQNGTVTLSAGCDGREGKFTISDDGADYDVIIVGAGLSGLSAAFYILQERPQTRILMLEANNYAGGNAARDEGSPLSVPASTAGAFCGFPQTEWLKKIYQELDIDWTKHVIQPPGDSYFFDEYTPGVKPGYRGWQASAGGAPEFMFTLDTIKDPPYDEKIMAELGRCSKDFSRWYDVPGGPDDPPDMSDPKYDYLSQMTLAEYITDVLGCDQTVVDFFTSYTIDCTGGTPYSVNAHTALSFLASEYTNQGLDNFAFPGGTSEIALRLVNWLKQHAVEIRLGAVALRIDMEANPAKPKVSATYFKDGTFHRATGRAMIVATQASSARRLIDHLVDSERRDAWSEFNTVPALIANVAVRDMTPFVATKLGYANHWWGSRYWANFEIADWTTENRYQPNRSSVLTFYGAVTVPPEEFATERLKLLQTPFKDYETSLKDDLTRVMRGTGFDFDRDVSAIYIYRWGHSMILPTTKSLFGNVRGPDGLLDRSRAPRRIACRPLGSISFAGQHTEGNPSVESALGSGYRAGNEVLRHL